VAALLLTGCASHTVQVHPPSPSGAVAAQCARLGDLVPERLQSLQPRVISPRSGLVHAWGSPAVVLTCGVGAPQGYSPTSSETTVVDGVQWYQQPGADVVRWTAIRPASPPAHLVYLDLAVPTHYQGQGAFLADLARPLKSAFP
jgi:Protein of unknown function (DUF3515)